MVNLIDDLSIFIYGAVAFQIKYNLLGSQILCLHRICRTDKAFLFWSDGTVTFDTHCLQLLLITLHKFAEKT